MAYFSFRQYKKEKKILFCLAAIYALVSIVLSIINISFVLYYNSEQDDQYFKNHPNLETLQNVNWYMLMIPIFLLFIIMTRNEYGSGSMYPLGSSRDFSGIFELLFKLLASPY